MRCELLDWQWGNVTFVNTVCRRAQNQEKFMHYICCGAMIISNLTEQQFLNTTLVIWFVKNLMCGFEEKKNLKKSFFS